MELTRTGDADANNGSSDKAKLPFMMETIYLYLIVLELRCAMVSALMMVVKVVALDGWGR